ncbi:GPI-anchored wall transfer protein 1 [Pholiota molesta]|nr:GPI-anchored wall transfer protein 1 [Pholiota molesta]
MTEGYKEAKESFVSGMSGSSITHINLLCLVALISVSLYAAIRTRVAPTRSISFFTSWALLVLPMLLAMTIAAEKPMYLIVGLCLPLAAVLRLPRSEAGTPLPSNVPASPSTPRHAAVSTLRKNKIPPLPALTTYRSHMMLMTVLAILAVDFPVFPRILAKCETYGVSLMDLGVGSFVFSQGIVSAMPLIRDPAYITAPMFPKLFTVTKHSLPVIVLGAFRVLLVKGTEYPEHVTEYGVHWNFFITLALLPILQVCLHPLIRILPVSAVGFLVGLVQQIALSRFHLRDYVFTAPRSSLISANKEGLVSLTGYLAIQILGLSVGTMVLPPTPSFFRRRQTAFAARATPPGSRKRRTSDADADRDAGTDAAFALDAPRQNDKIATELCAYAILWWGLLGLARVVRLDGAWGADGGASRRMVNLSYILWIAAFNTTFLLAYLVVLDMGFFGSWSASAKKTKQKNVGHEALHGRGDDRRAPSSMGNVAENGNPPRLLSVLNKHGLGVFLLANVLTGVVNLSMKTMYVGDLWALVVLCVYSLVVCGGPWLVERASGR